MSARARRRGRAEPPARSRRRSVFLNCPFDERCRPLRQAIHFAFAACGCRVRSTLEWDDSGTTRLDRIVTLIRASQLGVHDISRTQLDAASRLPRFNMPFELGLFLGLARVGHRNSKRCLVLDAAPYRYQKFLSDIAGQDIHAHGGRPERAISVIRDWLAGQTGGPRLPGAGRLVAKHRAFRRDLPKVCRGLALSHAELTFRDEQFAIRTWLRLNP